MHARYRYQAGEPYGNGGSFAGYAYVVNSVSHRKKIKSRFTVLRPRSPG